MPASRLIRTTLFVLMICSVPVGRDAAAQSASLEGKWVSVAGEVHGEPIPEASLPLLRLMNEVGAPILAGTDVNGDGRPPFLYAGFSLHEELELLVEAGLTSAEALRAATLEPARYLEATDSLGTVKEGMLADLVLLDANPLEDIRNTRRIQTVLADGRLFQKEDLLALREQVLLENYRKALDGR